MTVAEPQTARVAPSVAEELFSQPSRFSFLQAVHLLELMLDKRTPPGEGVNPDDELVLFRQYVGFDFPPSDVEFLVPPLEANEPVKMSVNVLGLAGARGPLPHHITELLLERSGRGDRALRDFLDIFNHRLVSLLYRARKKYRPSLDPKGPHRGRIARVLYSILGLGTQHLLDRLAIPERSLLPYAGLFAQQFRSSIGLERIVEDCFGVTAKIEQFHGTWHELDESDVTRIGARGQNHALGRGAILGCRVYDPTANFELRLGPLTYEQFVSFLPDGAAYEPLRSLVRFYAREELGFSFRLELAKEELPKLQFAKAQSTRLGWTSWLSTHAPGANDTQVVIAGSAH